MLYVDGMILLRWEIFDPESVSTTSQLQPTTSFPWSNYSYMDSYLNSTGLSEKLLSLYWPELKKVSAGQVFDSVVMEV